MNSINKDMLIPEIEKGIKNFMEENSINVLAVHDEIYTSTELGEFDNLQEKGNAKGRKMNEKLSQMGFLEENKNRSTKEQKWKLTEKGKKFAITPIKFIVSFTNDNKNILITLKKETHRWIGAIKEEIKNYNLEENKNEK